MAAQMTPLRERLIADFAVVRPQITVDSSMDLQGVFPQKRLPTIGTLVRFG